VCRQKRTHCAIITMKTSLRERWQEVVEEIERTKAPHIFLLTLDGGLNPSNLQAMKNHNITLVVPLPVQQANSDKSNVISFEQLFNVDLPHLLKNWE
jgi:3-keto-L-gulonate-6-phosphate decarboxylase